jgi:hypothetical protein
MGRRSTKGIVLEVMKARAVGTRVMGRIAKNEYRRRLCGVETRSERESVSYAMMGNS